MKFTCTKENLLHALGIVSGIASKQVHLPILSNILIHVTDAQVEFISTNLEVAISVGLRAKIESPGEFTVPAKTITDFVGLLSELQVEVSLEGNELILASGTSSTKIKGMSAEDFPVIPMLEKTQSYTFDAEALKQGLQQTVFAAAKNEIRPELSGVFFGFFVEETKGLTLAATDSYRLAQKKIPSDTDGETVTCIVPSRTVVEMIRLITLTDEDKGPKNLAMYVSETQIGVEYGTCRITSRLIEGKYPDYTQIIPTNLTTTVIFPVSMLIKQVKAASLFTTTGVNAVRFDIEANQKQVTISSTSTQTGEHTSVVDADVQGDTNSILLNHRYTLEGLQQIKGEDVVVKLNGPDAPCVFLSKETEDYLYIVMPIRQ